MALPNIHFSVSWAADKSESIGAVIIKSTFVAVRQNSLTQVNAPCLQPIKTRTLGPHIHAMWARSYFDFYKGHMAVEEKQIIPEALKVLTEEDWTTLDAAFAENTDPLSTSQPRDPIYDRLVSKITFRAPAPIGLGHS